MRARWVKFRPLTIANNHIVDYPTPVNLRYWWNFGSIAGLMLVVQLITGILLAMHYTCHVDMAFVRVEHIMRDVNNGWLLRYAHANGASFFFIAYIPTCSEDFITDLIWSHDTTYEQEV